MSSMVAPEAPQQLLNHDCKVFFTDFRQVLPHRITPMVPCNAV